jgi:FKBP-type peptidyl-prolyl cis-trans isomerase FkpA
MRKISYLLFATAVAFTACKESYKKGQDGMQYKIIADGKGDLIKQGDFMELHFTSILNGGGKKDSTLNSTRDMGAPQIVTFDTAGLPPAYAAIFKQLKKGDSVSTKTLVDSLFKKQPESMPPFMKKGQYVYTNIRVVNVYKTKEEAEKASEASRVAAEAIAKAKADGLVKIDDKTITDYLAKNNIKATKTPLGAYVEITQAGTGAMLDSNVFAKVNYTGKTLSDGKMFDSNTDPAKGHLEPLSVNLTNDMSLGGGVIPGMADALKMMQKGTKGKMYIPSGLGYGARGAGGDIPPNANLVFEVEVLDIMTKAQVKADNEVKQKKMMEMQKRYQDSMAKANPQAAQQMQQQQMQQQMQQQAPPQGAK